MVRISERRLEVLRREGKKYLEEADFESEKYFEKSERSKFLRAGGLNLAFPKTMSWHWAQDPITLEASRQTVKLEQLNQLNHQSDFDSHTKIRFLKRDNYFAFFPSQCLMISWGMP